MRRIGKHVHEHVPYFLRRMPGKIRQFTLAVARWGNALLACPPSNRVATQVVRMIE